MVRKDFSNEIGFREKKSIKSEKKRELMEDKNYKKKEKEGEHGVKRS